MSSNPKHYFLYAEDDLDDQDHFREIVKKISPQYESVICDNGLQLMKYMENLRPGDYLPCCIILDMNMPMLDGVGTLKQLKNHPVFNVLPVVMFTTSSAARDKELCSSLGAAEFLTKPLTEHELERCIKTFGKYCTATLDSDGAVN